MKKKLIEVALPLEAINKVSAREKSIRHGHPSTLHLWWARRPLAAARAVIFAQMVDDPSSHHGQFPTEEAQEKERQRLFKIIEDLVQWENTTNEEVLQRARDEIWQSWRRACKARSEWREERRESWTAEEIAKDESLFNPDKLPAFHDPFAGGGSLPLEAQRLGLEAYASDLNPVAVLICKAMVEIPSKFAGKPPVNPESREKYLGARASRPHKRWHSRGYLPHLDEPGLFQSITFRDEEHLGAVIAYIENNPVKAGLVERAEQWRFASAAARHRAERDSDPAGETPSLPGMEHSYRGARGLAEDVRYYGKWMRDEAEKRIGHLYPKIEVTSEMAKGRPDLKSYVGKRLTVIAWLWARTVKSPNPAFAKVEVPLASTFMLSTKAGKEAYVEPVFENGGYRFTVHALSGQTSASCFPCDHLLRV